VSEKAKKKKKTEEPEAAASSVDSSNDDDGGLAALSALVRASTAPPSPEKEGDDGKLDLRALTASLPAPPPMEPVARASDDDDEDEDEDEPERVAPKPVAQKPKKKKKAAAKPAVDEDEDEEAAPKVAARPKTEVAQPQQSNNGMWIAVGLVAVAVIGIAAWKFGFSGDDSQASDPLASSAPTRVDSDSVEAVEADTAADVRADDVEAENLVAANTQVEAPAADPAVEPAPVEEPVEPTEVAEREPAREGRERPVREARPAAEPQPAPQVEVRAETRVEAPPPRQERNIDSMLDDALGGRPNREGTQTEQAPRAERPAQQAQPAAQNNADLPSEPDRAQVARTLGRLMPRIRTCAGDQVGMAMAGIVISGDGSVATVNVSGSPFGGTPQGACMEGAIREARFPAFRGQSHRVNYPFNIR
jgi:hypothetical protein